jgi:hypothetical protein
MTLPPLAAGVGIEGIIWVIILIFWSIAQYVQKNRAAQRRPPMRPGVPPPPPTRPPTQMETELQDLLRELTGQPPLARDEEESEVEPEPVRPAPPPPPPQPQRTLASARKPAPPAPPPVRRAPEPAARPTLRPLQPDYIASVGELSEGMGAAFAHSGKMPGLTLKMPSVSLRGISFSGSSRLGHTVMPTFKLSTLREPATLRQMMIGRMVLDKPKALDNGSGC